MAKNSKKKLTTLSNDELSKLKSTAHHQTLPPELLERIRCVWDLVKDGCYEPNFERFEAGFLYDMHPEREIKVWESIAARYQKIKDAVTHVGCAARPKDWEKLQAILVAASTGATEHRGKIIDIADRLSRTPPPVTLAELLD